MKNYELLLIDDEAPVLHALERVLNGEGYRISNAMNAEDAMAVLAQRPVDLIICDYGLPGMNGVDLLEKIKKKYPNVIAVLLTGNADGNIAIEALNRFVLQKFLMKPWNDEELKGTVRKLLERQVVDLMKSLKAKDLMSKFAITVNETDSLLKVSHLMMRFKISGLPVVSREGKLTGIITATDLFRIMGRSVSKEISPETRRDVGQFMTRNVFTVQEEDSFADIINVMWKRDIHTLPVVKADEIIGVIGRRDVLNQYYKLFDKASEE